MAGMRIPGPFALYDVVGGARPPGSAPGAEYWTAEAIGVGERAAVATTSLGGELDHALEQTRHLVFKVGEARYRLRRLDGFGLLGDEELLPPKEAQAVLAQLAKQPGEVLPAPLVRAASAALSEASGPVATLALLRVRPPAAAPPKIIPADEPAPSKRPTKIAKDGWIEIEVVDDAGQPVSGRAYKLELPDGRTLTGTLGDSGVISLHGIDPGSAKFTLVDVDGPAWS